MEIQTIRFHSFIMVMSFLQQRYGAEKDGHHNLVSGLSKFREFAEQHCMLWTCFTVFCDLSQLLRALYLVLFSLQLSFAHIFAACCAQRPMSLWQFLGLKVAFLLPVFVFSVEPLVSLSEGSLHHDPSIYIELLDVFRNEGFKPNDGELKKITHSPQCTVNGILVPQSRIISYHTKFMFLESTVWCQAVMNGNNRYLRSTKTQVFKVAS